MKSINQFRVVFLAHANIAGRVVLQEFSTQWFDSEELAASSRWMNEIGAHIVSRVYTA